MSERLSAAEVVERLRTFENRLVKECDEADDEGDSILSDVRESEAVVVAICREAIEDNLIETPEQSRERFEQWWLECNGTSKRKSLRRAMGGDYAIKLVRLMFASWQAAQSFRSEQES